MKYTHVCFPFSSGAAEPRKVCDHLAGVPEGAVGCLVLVLLCNTGLSGLEGHSCLHLQQRGQGRNALVQCLECSTLFFEVTSKPFPSYQVRILVVLVDVSTLA